MHARHAASPRALTSRRLAVLSILVLLSACSIDSPVSATPEAASDAAEAKAERVRDLEVAYADGSAIVLRWTQVHDGTGEPARYAVRHRATPLGGDAADVGWDDAELGCEHVGDEVGSEASCVVGGLQPNTSYELRVTSFRGPVGEPAGAVASDPVTTSTSDADPWEMQILADVPTVTLSKKAGVWISRTEVGRLPKSGSAWNNVLAAADRTCGSVKLNDQNSSVNVCIMAKALVFARTGTSRYRRDVVTAIDQIVRSGTYSGSALALGRELGAYVIAADLIDLKNYNSDLDRRFRSKLRSLRTTYTSGGGVSNLIECHERRPNNWGAHCGATRAAIAVYLGETSEIARTARVFKGYLGDRSSYAGFSYGSTSWQCNPSRPVGINPSCTRDGLSLNGVLPDDQRRAGSFKKPPPKENYVWEALQGLLAQAVILHRAGYDVWSWQSRALRRAGTWLHGVANYPAEGDDRWQPYVLNYYYGTSFPTPRSPSPGKNVGWTDWTHAR